MDLNVLDQHSQPVNSSPRIYYPELDGLRFLAFLLVFIHHWGWYPLPCISLLHELGWIGVDLFFALSAFLFTKLLVTEHNSYGSINIRKFYLRRIFRIWPLYFFIVFLSVLSFVFEEGHAFKDIESIRITGLLTFTENVYNAFYGYNSLPFIAPLWTISYEEQFYLVIPLITMFLVRSGKILKITFLVFLVILLGLIRVWMIHKQATPIALWVLPVSHFEAILFGVIAGFGTFEFLASGRQSFLLFLLSALCLYAVSLAPPFSSLKQSMFITYLLIGLFSLLILLAVHYSNYLKAFFSNPILVFLGKRSFGLYVYHQLSIHVLDRIVKSQDVLPIPGVTTFFYALIITILLSVISYQFLEKPFLKLKQKFERVRSRPI